MLYGVIPSKFSLAQPNDPISTKFRRCANVMCRGIRWDETVIRHSNKTINPPVLSVEKYTLYLNPSVDRGHNLNFNLKFGTQSVYLITHCRVSTRRSLTCLGNSCIRVS